MACVRPRAEKGRGVEMKYELGQQLWKVECESTPFGKCECCGKTNYKQKYEVSLGNNFIEEITIKRHDEPVYGIWRELYISDHLTQKRESFIDTNEYCGYFSSPKLAQKYCDEMNKEVQNGR